MKIISEDILLEKIKYLSSMPHSALVEHCIYLEQENDNYKAQKYITDFISENGIICEKNKQIDQLTNNWNELEKWLRNNLKETIQKWGQQITDKGCIDVQMAIKNYGDVLDKMKKIKERGDK